MLSHENSSAERIDNIEKSLKRNEPMICSDIPARGVLEHHKCISRFEMFECAEISVA